MIMVLTQKEKDLMTELIEQRWLNYKIDVPDEWLKPEIDLYCKINGNAMDIRHVREKYITG